MNLTSNSYDNYKDGVHQNDFQYFLITGFAFVLLCSSVAAFVALRKGEGRQRFNTYFESQTDSITFEEFIQREFPSKTFNGSWWSDTELQWKDTVNCL